MRRLFGLWLLALLTGCGPSFTPALMFQLDDMMLPPSNGLHGPNPPVVGGTPNKSGKAGWTGKILVVSMPRTAAEHCKVHPAMKAIDQSLQAGSDQEVGCVGFVYEHAVAYRGQPGGSGYLQLTLLDWKSKTNLGSWTIKKWDKIPESADFASAYPELAAKVKELHR